MLFRSGFGPPWERDPELVSADVRQGLVSPQSARDDYGVVLDPESGAVDAAATGRERGRLKGGRLKGE